MLFKLIETCPTYWDVYREDQRLHKDIQSYTDALKIAHSAMRSYDHVEERTYNKSVFSWTKDEVEGIIKKRTDTVPAMSDGSFIIKGPILTYHNGGYVTIASPNP